MPLHLAPLSRRSFLRRTLSATAGLVAFNLHRANAATADPNHFALLSDTHIAGDPTTVLREVNMADHLKRAVQEVNALPVPPAGVFINGDCAVTRGLPEDYATFSELLKPISSRQTPIHMTMGNHDAREVFWNALNGSKPNALPVQARHLSVVEAPNANWFLLDSLDQTNKTPGVLGDEQRGWLTKELEARANKPAILMLHHNPFLATTGTNNALLDTEELLSIVVPRRHVKAVVFGHTHTWRLAEHEGVHLINLPAVAYKFGAEKFTGWIDANVKQSGITLEVRAHDTTHPEHGKVHELAWRA